jgi:hypothetical protein
MYNSSRFPASAEPGSPSSRNMSRPMIGRSIPRRNSRQPLPFEPFPTMCTWQSIRMSNEFRTVVAHGSDVRQR